MNQKSNRILLIVRIVLLVLIAFNMIFIFSMSHQSGKESTETSKSVTTVIAQTTIKDFEQKEPIEQNKIIEGLNKQIRSAAHFTEFGTLGALILLFLLTWKEQIFLRYLGAITITFLYACTDEWHQKLLGDGRAAQWIDIGVDTLGAAFFCSLVLIVFLICTRKRRRKNSP